MHPQSFLKSILAPLDGSKESEASLPYVIEMATRLKAEVTLLQVVRADYISINLEHIALMDSIRKTARDYLANLADSLKQKGLKVKYEVVEAGIDEAIEIIDYTQKHYMDVIIMSTHGRSGVRRWVLGSVASKILRQGNTPIMLIRTPGANED